jgi:cysteinyl-tRNA synthetase
VLSLYDTRARAVVAIEPATPGALTVYACGPTVYRDAHVGNMRTFLVTDLIARAAGRDGLTVRVVQNITDVGHMADDTGLGGVDEGQGDTDDRVLAQAGREGRGALDVARDYEARFHADLERLGIRPADVYPRASESIALMIDLISTLMDRGHAYVGADGSVLFDARSFDGYGALSGNRLEDLRPGHRFEGGPDPTKRFHADWALWKSAGHTRTQLVWDTPWGRGFPGWHIECSAMSLHHLGDIIDVHTGGIDLRFPHHEDERAQSDAAVGHEVVRHWVHAEHLLFEGRKMSKSAGNVVLVEDVISRGHDSLALRLAFLEHHYRQQMNLTWNVISASDTTLKRWRRRVNEWAADSSDPGDLDMVVSDVLAPLYEDLDTASVILRLRDIERDDAMPPARRRAIFLACDSVLALDLERPAENAEVPAEIALLLEQRAKARADRDWSRSDALRDQMAAAGFIVTDTAEGQTVTAG